jgi:hypothetical protein
MGYILGKRADLRSRFRKTSFGHSFVGFPDLACHVSLNLSRHPLLLDALVHDLIEDSPITLAGLSLSQLSLYSKKQLTLFFLSCGFKHLRPNSQVRLY